MVTKRLTVKQFDPRNAEILKKYNVDESLFIDGPRTTTAASQTSMTVSTLSNSYPIQSYVKNYNVLVTDIIITKKASVI